MAGKKCSRLEMIEMLNEAAEVEHMLALQYLFAAASMKNRAEEFSNEDRKYKQLDLARSWKAAIIRVGLEEMGHLRVVNEVLLAIGAEPHFNRPNFPVNYYYKKKGTDNGLVPMVLMRFDGKGDTIARFVRFESSSSDTKIPDTPGIPPESPEPDTVFYEHVAELYHDIIEGLKTTPDLFDLGIKDLPDEDYSSSEIFNNSMIGNKRLIPMISNLEDALKALEVVIEQGEGGPISEDDYQNSHLGIFRRIKRELNDERSIDPNFEPSRNVISNPLWRYHPESTEGVFDDNVTPEEKQRAKKDLSDCRCAHMVTEQICKDFLEIFNASYEVLIMWLRQIFGKKTESERERAALIQLAFFPYMTEVIQTLSDLMTEIKIPDTDFFLGPSYEISSSDLSFPAADKLRQFRIERFESIREFIEGLDHNPSSVTENFLDRIRYLRDTFCYLDKELLYLCDQGPRSDPKYSEAEGDFDPVVRMGTYLQLDFEGWAQLRLATDPDPSIEKRGCSGNGLAFADEPDLDRILRFQDPKSLRPELPDSIKIGVNVTRSKIITPEKVDDLSPQMQDKFKNARINLAGNPEFYGRNHIIAFDTQEQIDPFQLQVLPAESDTPLLDRSVKNPSEDGPHFLNMSSAERYGTGRSGNFSKAMDQNLQNIGRSDLIDKDPKIYWRERIKALEDALNDPTKKSSVPLNTSRLAYINKNLKDGVFEGSIMYMRMKFCVQYTHTLSGKHIRNVDLPITDAPWLIQYNMGFFDTDAMCFFVKGCIAFPLDKNQYKSP